MSVSVVVFDPPVVSSLTHRRGHEINIYRAEGIKYAYTTTSDSKSYVLCR